MMKYFRTLGYVESASLLALLFVAMPLKYFMGMPEAVRLVGTIHGVLFLMYVYASFSVGSELRWPLHRYLAAWIVASLPFGPILFNKKLLTAAY